MVFFAQKIGYRFGGYPPPPLYGQFFLRKGGYGFGDKIRKVVFEVAPNYCANILVPLEKETSSCLSFVSIPPIVGLIKGWNKCRMDEKYQWEGEGETHLFPFSCT